MKYQFVWWPPSRPRWRWNGIWFSRDMGALGFLYRWRLMLGWIEIRRYQQPDQRGNDNYMKRGTK